MRLATASFAYPHVANADRAELATRLVRSDVPDGTFVLATCLRIEIAIEGDVARLGDVVAGVLGPGAIDESVVRTNEASVVHLFRVAAGLESPVVGERDVLSQFRAALADAENLHGVAGLFAKTLESAVGSARDVHRVLPAAAHDSIAQIAAEVVGDLDRVAVLGSGLMATAVAERLVSVGRPVTMVARSPEKVTLEAIEVLPFDQAANVLATFAAVVSATSAKQRLIADEELQTVLARRSTELTLVDLAMPPDFDPPDGSAVRYFDIDRLAAMVEPQQRVVAADALACEMAIDMHRRIRTHAAVAPVISAMMRDADDVVDRTVQRFGGRLTSDGDIAVLRQAAHTVARTLLARPVSRLKDNDVDADDVAALAEAFGFGDPADG